jgi:uracil-DNA glycosylase
MKYEVLVKQVGQQWADFLKPFMCPDENGKCPYDEIGGYLKTQYEGGKKIYPTEKHDIFRAFRETPMEKLRVVILGTEPYNRPGHANGLAFGSLQQEYKDLPKSLMAIYEAIEQDVYNGFDQTRPQRTGTPGRPVINNETFIDDWPTQGVLMLNCALTTEEKQDEAHVAIWKPFTDFVLSNLWRIKRDIVFLAWGNTAIDAVRYKGSPENDSTQPTGGVNIFQAFVLTTEHPTDAIKQKRPWKTDHFSRTNVIINANSLGEQIRW